MSSNATVEFVPRSELAPLQINKTVGFARFDWLLDFRVRGHNDEYIILVHASVRVMDAFVRIHLYTPDLS